MLLLLPIIAFLLLYLIFRKSVGDIRIALLAASVFCTAALVIITELLSMPNLVTRGGVALAWLFVCLLALSWLIVKRSSNRDLTEDGKNEPEPWDTSLKIMVAGKAT